MDSKEVEVRQELWRPARARPCSTLDHRRHVPKAVTGWSKFARPLAKVVVCIPAYPETMRPTRFARLSIGVIPACHSPPLSTLCCDTIARC